MTQEVAKEKEEEVIAELDSFAELPDAPPKRKFRLSWVGYCATGVVLFWLLICLIGPTIAPFHEMDMEGDDSFLDAYSGEYGTFYLGTDYLGRPADDYYNYSSPAGWEFDPANPDVLVTPQLKTGRNIRTSFFEPNATTYMRCKATHRCPWARVDYDPTGNRAPRAGKKRPNVDTW